MALLTVHLPSEGKILVTVGQKVSPGDILAKGECLNCKSVDLASLLKIKPQEVKKILTKKIGDEIKSGEVFAKKSGVFSKSRLKSPISGVLESLDDKSGVLTIKTNDSEFTLKASTAGKVVDIEDGKEITIEVNGLEIEAKVGVGPKREGELTVLKNHHVRLFDLIADLEGKIVAAKSWSWGSLSKAKALGVVAVLGEEFEEDEFLSSGREKNLEFLGLGGADFSALVFSSENFEKVLKYHGCQVVAFGDGKSLFISKE